MNAGAFFHSTSSTFVQPWPAGPPGRLVKDEYGSGVVSGVGMAQMEAGPAQTVQHPPQEAGYPRLMSGETGQPCRLHLGETEPLLTYLCSETWSIIGTPCKTPRYLLTYPSDGILVKSHFWFPRYIYIMFMWFVETYFCFYFILKGGREGTGVGGRGVCVCGGGVLSHSILRGATLFIGEVGGGFPHGSC